MRARVASLWRARRDLACVGDFSKKILIKNFQFIIHNSTIQQFTIVFLLKDSFDSSVDATGSRRGLSISEGAHSNEFAALVALVGVCSIWALGRRYIHRYSRYLAAEERGILRKSCPIARTTFAHAHTHTYTQRLRTA